MLCSWVALVWSAAELARHEGAAQRQLGGSEAERFARQRLGHAVELVEHLARRDLGDVVLGVALAVAHAHFGGLLRDRLVGEHADPDPAAALDVARNRAPRRLDLARGQAPAIGALEAEVAERHGIAARRDAGVASLLLLAEFSACRLQHLGSPSYSVFVPPSAGAALRTRRAAAGADASAPASAGLSLPSLGAP